MGFPKSMGDYIQPSLKFCNFNTLEFEKDTKLPARQKLWAWILESLQGPRASPGPFYYITLQCKAYDISHLFKRLYEVLETVTICSLDDEVYAVTHMEFDPTTQDLFSYLEDLKKAGRRLDEVNSRLPESGRVIFSDAYYRSRLIRAARQIPMYKPAYYPAYK